MKVFAVASSLQATVKKPENAMFNRPASHRIAPPGSSGIVLLIPALWYVIRLMHARRSRIPAATLHPCFPAPKSHRMGQLWPAVDPPF